VSRHVFVYQFYLCSYDFPIGYYKCSDSNDILWFFILFSIMMIVCRLEVLIILKLKMFGIEGDQLKW